MDATFGSGVAGRAHNLASDQVTVSRLLDGSPGV